MIARKNAFLSFPNGWNEGENNNKKKLCKKEVED
jgi:hypothetical protein